MPVCRMNDPHVVTTLLMLQAAEHGDFPSVSIEIIRRFQIIGQLSQCRMVDNGCKGVDTNMPFTDFSCLSLWLPNTFLLSLI